MNAREKMLLRHFVNEIAGRSVRSRPENSGLVSCGAVDRAVAEAEARTLANIALHMQGCIDGHTRMPSLAELEYADGLEKDARKTLQAMRTAEGTRPWCGSMTTVSVWTIVGSERVVQPGHLALFALREWDDFYVERRGLFIVVPHGQRDACTARVEAWGSSDPATPVQVSAIRDYVVSLGGQTWDFDKGWH